MGTWKISTEGDAGTVGTVTTCGLAGGKKKTDVGVIGKVCAWTQHAQSVQVRPQLPSGRSSAQALSHRPLSTAEAAIVAGRKPANTTTSNAARIVFGYTTNGVVRQRWDGPARVIVVPLDPPWHGIIYGLRLRELAHGVAVRQFWLTRTNCSAWEEL